MVLLFKEYRQMSKLQCHCGNIMSNVSDSNKVQFTCVDAQDDTCVDLWICPCGDYVNVNGKWYLGDENESI